MITTGSKFFYGLAATLLVTAVVYGYTTGGDVLGALSAGYKGGVGDHLGYSVLLGGAGIAAFMGGVVTAFRDADPEAEAELLGLDTPPATVPAGPSFWPIVGAFGVGLTIVGLVVNNVFFVAGLIAIGAVAIEWTVQVWADRATGDHEVNKAIRNRIMLPLEIPIAGVLAIAVVVIGFSRFFLATTKDGAWIGASVIAALVFGIGAILNARPKIRTDLVAGLLVVFAIGTITVGIVSAVQGERDFHEHESEEEHDEEGGDQSEGDGEALVTEETGS